MVLESGLGLTIYGWMPNKRMWGGPGSASRNVVLKHNKKTRNSWIERRFGGTLFDGRIALCAPKVPHRLEI